MGTTAAARRLAVSRQRRMAWWHALVLSPWSVRALIVGLILVVVAPMLAFSAYLVLRAAEHEEAVTANTVRERTRQAASVIDHELGSLRSRLLMLVSANSLQEGDFGVFRSQAIEAFGREGLSVVVSDTAGRELVNTRARMRDQLPKTLDMDAISRALDTGEPDVSTLTRDAVTGEMFISINAPVFRNSQLAYVVSLNIAPLLPRMLTALHMPQDWLVNIADRAGYTIARSLDAERFVGQMGRPDVLERLRALDEGWLPLVSRDGIPIYNSFAHVKFSGWLLSVGIPDDVLFAPVRHSTWILGLTGAATLTLALLLGVLIGRRIAGSISLLVGYAEQVGRGERITVSAGTGTRETDAVVRSLHASSERLQQSAQEQAVLLDRTVTAQESERKRIARELHDSLGQYLTALRLGLGEIEPACACNLAAQRCIAELKRLATEIGRELSRIAWELRPMALDDLGLRRAVTQYLEEWADRSRLYIDLEIKLDDRRLPHAVETALFRVLQEAVTNVVKHSGAGRVGVILEATDTEARLIVEDDGRGFALPSGSDGPVPGLGLLGVRERVILAGGTLEVESSVQGGTTVFVRIPL